MSYLDRIKASYQAGKLDTIAAREQARKKAAEKRAAATLAARKAPPIPAVRAVGRIIESTRPAITGTQKIAGSISKLSQPKKQSQSPRPKKRRRSQKIRSVESQPKKSMLW
jgi:hypothetical protein